jgi:hypothetical protein
VTWLWDAIAGCTAPGMNLGAALVILVGRLFFVLIRGVVSLLNQLLALTVLNTGGSTSLVHGILGTSSAPSAVLLTMDGIGVLVAAAAVVWGALQLNVAGLLGARRDEGRALVGRTGAALVWIVATPLAIALLLGINDAIVNVFLHLTSYNGLMGAFQGGVCTGSNTGKAVAEFGITLGSGVTAYMLFYFLMVPMLLAFLVGVVVAFAQYFLRLFQVLFWGLLLPVAAGASVADPQRRAWTYVWGQVSGAIFTQAALAIGIYVNESIMVGGTPSPIAAAHHVILLSAPSGASGSVTLLRFLVGVAGFFLIARIPRYFQELQGHSVGGGSEMVGIVGGYMMGRLGMRALAASRAGVLMEGAGEAQTARYKAELGGPPPSFWQSPLRSMGSTMYRGYQASALAAAGVVHRQAAQARAAVGATDSDVAAETAAKISIADAQGRNPAALDVNAATNPRNDVTPQPPTRGPGTALVDAPGRPTGPGPTHPSTPGGPGNPLAGLGVEAGGLAGAMVVSRPTAPADRSYDGMVPPPDTFGDPTASGGGPGPSSAGGAPSDPGRPLFGPGSSLATGPGTPPRSGADFAAAMAPLVVSYLRGQVVPAQAAAQGGRAAMFMDAVNRPVPLTASAMEADQKALDHERKALQYQPGAQRTLQRAQVLRHWEQQIAIHPEVALARLFQVEPSALSDPAQQAHIEQHLRAALTSQPAAATPLGSLLRPQSTTDPGWETPPA